MTPTPDPGYTLITPITATVTVTPTPAPPDSPALTDQLQAWGTVGAVVAALVIAVAGWIITSVQRRNDQREASNQRQQDRDEERARDRRDFLIQQLQRAADFYAQYKGSDREFSRFHQEDDLGRRHAERVAVQRLRAYIATIPSHYASLLKVQVFGSSHPLIDEWTRREARRRVPDPDGPGVGPIDDEEIYREIADNIDELLGRKGTPDG